MRSDINLDPSYVLSIDENEWRKKFAFKLDKMMRTNSITNLDLANALGIHQSTVRSYRMGISVPNAYFVVLICRALGCSISALMEC